MSRRYSRRKHGKPILFANSFFIWHRHPASRTELSRSSASRRARDLLGASFRSEAFRLAKPLFASISYIVCTHFSHTENSRITHMHFDARPVVTATASNTELRVIYARESKRREGHRRSLLVKSRLGFDSTRLDSCNRLWDWSLYVF